MDKAKDVQRKWAANKIPLKKFISGEYAIKEVDTRMLRSMGCEFVLRISGQGVFPEVVVPKSEFILKDKSMVVPYYDYQAAMGFLGSISAAAFDEAKDVESADVKSAVLSLMVNNLMGFQLNERTIGQETKVKKVGLYVLRAAHLFGLLGRFQEGKSNVEHSSRVRETLRKMLSEVPDLIKKEIEDNGWDKLNPDRPCGDKILTWLHGKINGFPLPKDFKEEVPAQGDLSRFLFGKEWKTGVYLSWDELSKAPLGFEGLSDIKPFIASILTTLPKDQGVDPMIDGTIPNFQNKFTKAVMEKRRFFLAPSERIPFEPMKDVRLDSYEPSVSKAIVAIDALISMRAGEFEHRLSARPVMATNNPKASLELVMNPDYVKELGKIPGGQQREYKERQRELLFKDLKALATGHETNFTYENGWVKRKSTPKVLTVLSNLVGMSFPDVPVPPEAEGALRRGHSSTNVGGPLAKMQEVTPADKDVAGEIARLKTVRKSKKVKTSTTTQGFLGLLKQYNPQLDPTAIGCLEATGSVPDSIKAQITAAKLFPASRTLAGKSVETRFFTPGEGSDSDDDHPYAR